MIDWLSMAVIILNSTLAQVTFAQGHWMVSVLYVVATVYLTRAMFKSFDVDLDIERSRGRVSALDDVNADLRERSAALDRKLGRRRATVQDQGGDSTAEPQSRKVGQLGENESLAK